MGKWEKMKLGQVTTVRGGYAFKSTEFLQNRVPIIRIGNLNGDTVDLDYNICISQDFWDKNEAFRVKTGDILIAMSGATVGKIGRFIINEPALLNQRVGLIRVNVEKIDTNYVYRYVKSILFFKQIQQMSFGCAQPNISAKQIESISIPLPPLEAQKQIAKTLDTAAELLAMRKQQLVGLDNLIKSTFYDMFGDPVTNSMGWDYCLVEETIKVLEAGWSADGVQRKKKSEEKAVLKVSAVTSGYFRAAEYKVLDKDTEIKKYVFPHMGDILFSRANTRELVGATCIIYHDFPDLLLPDKLWRIEFKSITNFVYMKYILSDNSVRSSLSNISTGTSGSMYNVSMAKLKSINIPLPPISLQTQFAEIVTKIEEQKALVKKAIEETQYLFDSLMSEYFE